MVDYKDDEEENDLDENDEMLNTNNKMRKTKKRYEI